LTLKKHLAIVFALIVVLGTFKLVTAPKTAARYYNYAWALTEAENYGGALRGLDIAVAYNPKDTKAYLERAHVHRRLGNYSLALVDCNKAIDIAPNYARAYASRGQTYYHLGEYARALNDFEKAISFDHSESETLAKWIEAAKKNL
jgi:tetratricopeptide (TPR) repeat protein